MFCLAETGAVIEGEVVEVEVVIDEEVKKDRMEGMCDASVDISFDVLLGSVGSLAIPRWQRRR